MPVRISRGVLVLAIFVMAALSLLGATGEAMAKPEDRLTYYSDYFSFTGSDAEGRVAFALDTNRGQDGAGFQAEHFVVLHDEQRGWQDMKGRGDFPNPEGVLEAIPDSAYFQFQGSAETGIEIRSTANGLVLRIDPVAIHMSEDSTNRTRKLGSAPGTLDWQGRTLRGRVIYEFLHMDDWNRLTRKYWGFWKDFQGFYLVTGDPVTEKSGDFYLRSQKTGHSRTRQRLADGFMTLGDQVIRLKDAGIKVEKRTLALGLYRWSRQWEGRRAAETATAEGEPDKVRFDLRTVDHRTISNWVIGGFAMSIVSGEILFGDRTLPLYGLGEFVK